MSDKLEKIKSNWEKYEKLCKRLEDENIDKMIEYLGERLIFCPASTRLSQYNSEPGGLIEHLLNVTVLMKSLSNAAGLDLPMESILKVGLFHDIGKVGDLQNDLFVDQDSSWHREKLGENYKYNEDISKMSISHRTLFLLQHFHIELTREEWVAIQISGGSHFEENRFYVGSETTLGIIAQKAKSIAIHKETI